MNIASQVGKEVTPTIYYTKFRSNPKTKKPEANGQLIKVESFESFFEELSAPSTFKTKDSCPLFNFITYTDNYRTNANFEQSQAVIGDYDKGDLSINDAAALFEKHGIKAFFYTSARHTPSTPKWRVIVPLSQPIYAPRHIDLLGMVNWTLDGALDTTSFTLSQCFYYGKVEATEQHYQTRLVDGLALDVWLLFHNDLPKVIPDGLVKSLDKKEKSDNDDDFISNDYRTITPEKKQQIREILSHFDSGHYDDYHKFMDKLVKCEPEDDAWELMDEFLAKDEEYRNNPARRNEISAKWDNYNLKAKNEPLENDIVWALVGVGRNNFPNKFNALPDKFKTFNRSERSGAGYELTELGNASRMIDLHGNKLRIVSGVDKWLQWDNGAWVWCDEETIRFKIHGLHKDIYQEGSSNPQDYKTYASWAKQSQKNSVISNTETLMKDFPQLRIPLNYLDNNPYLLGIDNAKSVINLETGEVRVSTRDDYVTKTIGVDYVGDSSLAVRWKQFLLEVLGDDAELIDWVKRWCGYMLTGMTNEQILLFCYGHGANGKGVFFDTLALIMGDYKRSISSDTLTETKRLASGASPDLASLMGARMVISTETEDGRPFNETQLKQFVSEDTITARALYKEPFEFKPNFKLMISGNHKPVIKGNDYSIWRRMRLLPFTKTFTENNRDNYLGSKLRKEAPHILAWVVEGCLDWQERGLKDVPKTIETATEEYRKEQDVLDQYLTDNCITGKGGEVKASILYRDYKQWCAENGNSPCAMKKFSQRMEEKKFKKRRIGKGCHYLDVLIQDPFENINQTV